MNEVQGPTHERLMGEPLSSLLLKDVSIDAGAHPVRPLIGRTSYRLARRRLSTYTLVATCQIFR